MPTLSGEIIFSNSKFSYPGNYFWEFPFSEIHFPGVKNREIFDPENNSRGLEDKNM